MKQSLTALLLTLALFCCLLTGCGPTPDVPGGSEGSNGSSSGSTSSGGMVRVTPRPEQAGQAPKGELKENIRGASSSMLMPQSGQA